MKFAFLTIFLLLVAFAAPIAAQAGNQADAVKRFREIRDKGFRDPALSPLMREDFANFKGLEYFDISPKFAVKAAFEKTTGGQSLMIPTTHGTTRKYLKVGVLKFEIDGRSLSLNAYQTEAGAIRKDPLFVPFKDLTNGSETYGAGRYLNIEPPADAAALDFNFAYNMSCAYGREEFSCTIPPKENFLQVAIRAGEKIFPHFVKKQ